MTEERDDIGVSDLFYEPCIIHDLVLNNLLTSLLTSLPSFPSFPPLLSLSLSLPSVPPSSEIVPMIDKIIRSTPTPLVLGVPSTSHDGREYHQVDKGLRDGIQSTPRKYRPWT